jgi:tetratricopeptide (TPR) repeat protein
MRLSVLIASYTFLSLASVAAFAQSPHGNPADARQGAAAAFEEGQNAQQRGDLNSAVRFYSSAIKNDPSLFQAYYQRATALAALGRDAEAETDLRKTVELRPDFSRAYRALGQILLDRGMTEEAKRELSRSIELEPKLGGVRIPYASALIKSGEAERAIAQLRAAIEQGESAPLAYALLGVAEERIGKPDDAFADYSRAIEMDASNATAREGRARIFENRGELAKAIQDYSAAYRAHPSQEVGIKLANLHARIGQPQAAIQAYRALIQEKPNDLLLRAELARLLSESGQTEDAMKEMSALITVNPRDAKLLVIAGDIFFKDKPEVAADYYRKAVESDPSNNHARVQLAASLVRAMKYEAALPLLADAISREANNYAAHANLATAFFKLQRYPDAAREFLWVIGVRPEVAASYFFLAISLDKLGDCQQALRAYQEFVRRADPAMSKNEVEEANIRLGLLQRLAKEGKCKSPLKGKSK